jgi:MerR family transcriptional regulator/heat shock protein HspR
VEQKLLLISGAAQALGMHPQTLRKYERLGLVRPTRTVGSMRLYSVGEIERLRLIKHLVEEVGLNLAGVRQVLSIAEVVQRMRPFAQHDALTRVESRRRLVVEIERLTTLLGMKG